MQNRIVELSNSWRKAWKAWNLACNSGSNQERPLPTRPKIVCDKLPSHEGVVVTTTRRRRLGVSMPLIVTVMV